MELTQDWVQLRMCGISGVEPSGILAESWLVG
jgi:hypothetical protein